MLLQPSTASMNPAYFTTLGIAAMFLDPIPRSHIAVLLFLQHFAATAVILAAIFSSPFLNAEISIFFFVVVWPVAALVGRLAMDHRDRLAFITSELTAASLRTLEQQAALRRRVLEDAAPPEHRRMMDAIQNTTTPTPMNTNRETTGDAHCAPQVSPLSGATSTDERGMHSRNTATSITARCSQEPRTSRGRPTVDYAQLRTAAAGLPAGVLHLHHVVTVRIRFDTAMSYVPPTPAVSTTDAMPALSPARSGDRPADEVDDGTQQHGVEAAPRARARAHATSANAGQAAILQRSQHFFAFMCLVDELLTQYGPLSTIEARGDEVLIGGPWGVPTGGIDPHNPDGTPPTSPFPSAHNAPGYCARQAVVFLQVLRRHTTSLSSSSPPSSSFPSSPTVQRSKYHFNDKKLIFSAIATAEDAFVLLRSTLYPTFDVLGPGPERVRELLRAAPPGTIATTDAFQRCLAEYEGPVAAESNALPLHQKTEHLVMMEKNRTESAATVSVGLSARPDEKYPTTPSAPQWALRHNFRTHMTFLQ